MLRFKSLAGAIGALLMPLLMVSPADASIVQGLELHELVAHADRIVLGRVLFSESFVQHPSGQLGTWHRIAVERELRGDAPDEQEVMVETLGGQIGDIAMRVEGEPSFTVGERVLVFIHDGGPYTAFRPVGMGQGVMRVRTEQGIETVQAEPRGPDAHAPQREGPAWSGASARFQRRSASTRLLSETARHGRAARRGAANE